jgi:flagellar export protein FliJ
VDHLAVLVRLAGLEVERERRALAELDATLDQLRHQIALARAEAERERRAATDLAGARLLAAYLAASGRRLRMAATELARLEQARAGQLTRLIEQRLELKRLELLRARDAQRRQVEASRRAQRNIDELALIGAARRR